jgi:hypothetical protein
MNPVINKGIRACALFIVGCFLMAVPPLSAETAYIIDTPNMGMLDYGSYNLNFRLFNNGGILSRLNFGVFKIVNLGVGWELSSVIGDRDISVSPPSLYLKIRPFTGGTILPAFAFGYDGQGYFYDKDNSEYLLKEKGVFVVFGRELFFPGFELNIGGNMNDFKTNTVYGFANFSVNVEDKFYLLGEYDNINYFPESILNLGVRFAVTEYLTIDLAGRDVGAAGRSAERIVRVNYQGRF